MKLRKDEVIRTEIDNLLLPAIESRNVEQLELHLHNATHCSVTSKTIEAARLLSGQLRNQGDRSRIEILLRDSLRLRSVAVLEHVEKSAVEAGKFSVPYIITFYLMYFCRLLIIANNFLFLYFGFPSSSLSLFLSHSLSLSICLSISQSNSVSSTLAIFA